MVDFHRFRTCVAVCGRSRCVLLLLRLCVGGAFIYAGALKMGTPAAFADSIASFQVVPPIAINALALALPVFELLAGFLVIIGRPRGLGALAIFSLCVVFALALGQALIRGLEVDCGCFGGGPPSLGKTWVALLRDFLLGTGAFWIYWRESR